MLQSGHSDFFNVKLIGKLFTGKETASQGLPVRLDIKQRGELMKAYEDAGKNVLITEPEGLVQYYTGVSYCVKVDPDGTKIANLSNNGETQSDPSDQTDHINVTITAGNVVEFVCEEETDGRGFARVLAIMRHYDFVFLTLRWITDTGRRHPRLQMREFVERGMFECSCFQPVTIVDEQRFVDSVHFVELDGKLLLNEWIFSLS